MSRAAKAFFAFSVLASGGTIYGVHYIQTQERIVSFPFFPISVSISIAEPRLETMFAGVLRDDERLKAKATQRAREAEFEDQARKRAVLENIQAVSNPVTPPTPYRGEIPLTTDGIDFGCKDCEK